MGPNVALGTAEDILAGKTHKKNRTKASHVVAAGICFTFFVGFDRLTTLGGEALDPSRSIPISLVTTLSISSLLYLGISVGMNAPCTAPSTLLTHHSSFIIFIPHFSLLTHLLTLHSSLLLVLIGLVSAKTINVDEPLVAAFRDSGAERFTLVVIVG